MRLLITCVDGFFDDLTGFDRRLSAAVRWAIGQTLVECGSQGALTIRPDVSGARFLPVFERDVLGTTMQG